MPNFSEGTNPEVVDEIVRAMRVDGVHLLDYSLDADHNRSVVTIAGPPKAVLEAAVRGVGRASQLIHLTRQTGVHPRIGVADVLPFVPVTGVSLGECARLAREAGMAIWRQHGVPVYFYEAAAVRPDRVNLEDIRRGQFEGLQRDVLRDATRRPDVGGPELHHSAGATAVGARQFLIAWNVYLRPPANVGTARAIARDLRESTGGLLAVKAMGVMADGRPQVSMNLTDFRVTPVSRVFTRLRQLANDRGIELAEAELVGLIPEAAYEPNEDWVRQTVEFEPEQKILERRLAHPLSWP